MHFSVAILWHHFGLLESAMGIKQNLMTNKLINKWKNKRKITEFKKKNHLLQNLFSVKSKEYITKNTLTSQTLSRWDSDQSIDIESRI